MNLFVMTGKNYHWIDETMLTTVELGSLVFDIEGEKMYMALEPGILTEMNIATIPVETVEQLLEAVAAGGLIEITKDIDAPTAVNIVVDTIVKLNGNISIFEDTAGDGVFKVIEGTLTLSGKGTVNGVGKNDWNMAVWAKENGKVVINDGYFTNEGATANVDPAHFDLIYASDNAQIEINGGEFKCQTPAWTLNIKDKDRATASIVVKGGKFHGFDPSNCASEGPNTNFVAPGYKVVEENGVFTVMPE